MFKLECPIVGLILVEIVGSLLTIDRRIVVNAILQMAPLRDFFEHNRVVQSPFTIAVDVPLCSV